MSIHYIETNDGPLFWYKQSYLIMHKDRLFVVSTENYLAELMLSEVSEKKIPVVITYPQVPFCPSRYLLRLQYNTILSLFTPPLHHREDVSFTGRSVAFYPMRHIPGDPGYIHHIAGRQRDCITPNVNLIKNWMKKVSRARIEKKLLALSMGLHPRLGAGSPLFEIGSDILFSVVIQRY